MQRESIAIYGPDERVSHGEGDVARTSAPMRTLLTVMWAAGGIIGGTACIIVPVLHLITTWGLPLLGIVMAVRTWRREIVIYQPQGICPNCDEKFELHGGATNETGWQVCPHCNAQLRLQPEGAPIENPQSQTS